MLPPARPIYFHHIIPYLILQPCKELKAKTGYESAELRIIDLARIASVIDFAERFEKEGGRIDILLLNAATVPVPGQHLTADGYEPVSVIHS